MDLVLDTLDLEREREFNYEVRDREFQFDLCLLALILVLLIDDRMTGDLDLCFGDDEELLFLIVNRRVDEDLDLFLPLLVVDVDDCIVVAVDSIHVDALLHVLFLRLL